MKKILTIMLVAALFVAMLAVFSITGCKQKVSTETTAGTTAAETTAKEVVTLNMAHWYKEGFALQPEMVKWTKEFEDENPDIKINWTWGVEVDALRARFASGQTYDAFWNNRDVILTMAQEGLLMKVDDYFKTNNHEGDTNWLETFYPTLVERAYLETAPDGAGYYGIPEMLDTWGFYYNKAIFGDNNISIPQTWDEFITDCNTLKDLGITPLAVDGNIDVYMNWYIQTLMARIVGYDNFLATALNKEGTTFNTPEFLKSAQFATSLIPFFQKGYQGSQYPAAQIEFSQGKMAMIGMGTWLAGEIRETAASDFSMDIFRFPAISEGKGDQTAIELNWLGWAIPKDSQHPEETARLIKFFTSKKIQEEHVSVGRNVAVIQGLPFPEWAEGVEKMLNEAQSTWPLLHDLRFQAGDWYSSVYLPTSSELMFGELSPEEYITNLQAENENFYAKK